MESATGFSQNVGMSRRTAASIKSACELDDAAIRTPSMPDARRAAGSVADCTSSSVATSAVRRASTSVTTSESTPFSVSRFRAW